MILSLLVFVLGLSLHASELLTCLEGAHYKGWATVDKGPLAGSIVLRSIDETQSSPNYKASSYFVVTKDGIFEWSPQSVHDLRRPLRITLGVGKDPLIGELQQMGRDSFFLMIKGDGMAKSLQQILPTTKVSLAKGSESSQKLKFAMERSARWLENLVAQDVVALKEKEFQKNPQLYPTVLHSSMLTQDGVPSQEDLISYQCRSPHIDELIKFIDHCEAWLSEDTSAKLRGKYAKASRCPSVIESRIGTRPKSSAGQPISTPEGKP